MNKLLNTITKYTKRRKNSSPEYSFLIIGSHGLIDLEPDYCYSTPMKLKKINAASIGCSNFISDEKIENFVEDVFDYTNKKQEKKRSSKKMIKDIQKKMCDITNNVVIDFNKCPNEKSRSEELFIENQKYHNKVCKAKKGDDLLGKCYMKYFDEHYDTLILFHNGEKIVLDDLYNSHDDKTKYIFMSELLEIIKDKFQIKKLIVMDLSCSNITDNDEKFCRQMRTYLKYFFNIRYGGKTIKIKTKKKRTKKRRKTKKTKRQKKTTIRRNKTHKNKK